MTKVGIAGVGFMGWIHYLAYQQRDDIQLAAICTRNEQKLAGDWSSIKGNFGPQADQVDVSSLACYSNVSDMLADPELDLIDICLPPDMHLPVALEALEAGKHVFCEKPLALEPEHCDQLVTAAAAADRLLLVGHVLPFLPEYMFLREAIADGRYGALLGGHFDRVISDPEWLPDFYDPQRVGGPLIDLHVHDAHLIRLLLGMPTEVVSRGRMRGEVVEYCQSLFTFADESLVVSSTSGVIQQQGRGFMHGYEVHFEQATLQFRFSALADEPELSPLKVLTSDGQVERPELGDGDMIVAFAAEIAEVTASLAAGQPSQLISGELARDAIILCQRQTESVLQGAPVSVS
jgi:predicted dehydrogenase